MRNLLVIQYEDLSSNSWKPIKGRHSSVVCNPSIPTATGREGVVGMGRDRIPQSSHTKRLDLCSGEQETLSPTRQMWKADPVLSSSHTWGMHVK